MVLDVAGWMSLLRLFGALGNVNLRFEDARARKPQFSLHDREPGLTTLRLSSIADDAQGDVFGCRQVSSSFC
jgi:hypothetical protein